MSNNNTLDKLHSFEHKLPVSESRSNQNIVYDIKIKISSEAYVYDGKGEGYTKASSNLIRFRIWIPVCITNRDLRSVYTVTLC